MILGIGSDMVSLDRIQNLVQQYGQKFYKRILADEEQVVMMKLNKENHISYLAKRFAGKEAVSKALGTGISGGIHFTDIVITNYKTGRPRVVLKNKALEVFTELKKDHQKADIAITLTDEPPFAQAMVIISAETTTTT